MDALLYMYDMISDTVEFYGERREVEGLREFMKSINFRDLPMANQEAIIKSVRLTAPKVGKLKSEFVGHASRKQSSSSESRYWWTQYYREKIIYLIRGMIEVAVEKSGLSYLSLGSRCTYTEDFESLFAEIEASSFWKQIWNIKFENIENKLLEEADISNCIKLNEVESTGLFFKKAFPALDNMQNDHERQSTFFYEIHKELDLLHLDIPKACAEYPLAILLMGGLLSLKPMANYIWKRVRDDLDKIKKSSSDFMGHIFTNCYNDLPYFLQPCFLHFACYPIGYEIPATSLTQIWIAEGFVEEEDKQTSLETTANKYLEELVQRSLVFVSKRSFLGTIKSCRLPRSIHEFVIQQSRQSYEDEFLVANPDPEKIESLFRVAIHHDNKKQYTEVKNNHIHSFLAFNFDRNVLESAMLLRVLELRKSAIPIVALRNMIYLKYLVLRGSNISELPKNIREMKYLQTLDVRDTSIETLPKSLWNIEKHRHVYVKPSPKPSPQIKGPPSAAQIDNLHTLKTVAAHESWVENIPHFLIHLTKLALSNWDNLDWKSISILLSHVDKLISMAIMGKFIPSEFVDTRAFPNLETVKSIKLEGKWIRGKLIIDNVKFPPNLTKLTLTKSGLKEDPMPALERLQALKFLSLQDGAYIGKQMVCSANGFPQLQFLELSKLENLEKWEVKPTAMSQLTTLRVVQCQKLIGNHPNLDHVTDKVIN